MDKQENSKSDNISQDVNMAEDQIKKLPYPKSIPFIISNEFCERFNYYGMRTILVLYLNNILEYNKDDSTVIYHIFAMAVYFLCILGAILADSWLGKFKTILSLSIVYVLGSVLLSLGAISDLNMPAREITLLGLFLVALGSGGIKPCVAAFGGDQFKLPEQAKQMATFFSIFYFSINSGSLISTTVTPLLREDVHCFNKTSCYSLAFGVPAILMFVSVVIFVIGRPMYKIVPLSGNMVVLVSKAIWNAIATKCKKRKYVSKEHWLDYAEDKYGAKLIFDIKVLLRVLVLYIPLPFFWALFDQQGSRWTFQASRMDGVLGTINIKPDQMQLINPLLILVFIPLYEAFFYPLLAKIGIKRPLQKLFCGGVLAAVAFTISGIVELELEKTYPVLPESNQCELRIFNGYPHCEYVFKTDIPDYSEIKIGSLQEFKTKFIDVSKTDEFQFSAITSSPDCENIPEGQLKLLGGKAISFFLTGPSANLLRYIDSTDKPEKGSPEFRVLANLKQTNDIILKNTLQDNKEVYKNNETYYKLTETVASTYDVFVNDLKIMSGIELKQGGVYTILIGQNGIDDYKAKLIQITDANSLHILWLVPQFFVMTLGEVMFSVTGLEFSYSQAPMSMKSVLQACWLLTVAIGNAIVVIIAEAKIFKLQSAEFFLFAGLMIADMLLFCWLAYRYQPNTNNEHDDSDATVSVGENIADDLRKGK